MNEAFENSQGGHGDEEPFGQSKKRKSTGRLSFSWRNCRASSSSTTKVKTQQTDGRRPNDPNVVVARAEQPDDSVAVKQLHVSMCLHWPAWACTGAQMRWPPPLLVCRLPGPRPTYRPHLKATPPMTTRLAWSCQSHRYGSHRHHQYPHYHQGQTSRSRRLLLLHVFLRRGLPLLRPPTIVASFGGAAAATPSSGPNSEPRRISRTKPFWKIVERKAMGPQRSPRRLWAESPTSALEQPSEVPKPLVTKHAALETEGIPADRSTSAEGSMSTGRELVRNLAITTTKKSPELADMLSAESQAQTPFVQVKVSFHVLAGGNGGAMLLPRVRIRPILRQPMMSPFPPAAAEPQPPPSLSLVQPLPSLPLVRVKVKCSVFPTGNGDTVLLPRVEIEPMVSQSSTRSNMELPPLSALAAAPSPAHLLALPSALPASEPDALAESGSFCPVLPSCLSTRNVAEPLMAAVMPMADATAIAAVAHTSHSISVPSSTPAPKTHVAQSPTPSKWPSVASTLTGHLRSSVHHTTLQPAPMHPEHAQPIEENRSTPRRRAEEAAVSL